MSSVETKNQIKNRMIKKAASLWGVSPNEIESSFDPIVALLIGACASEIEKIATEIEASQTRVTERLIQLMTPETIYGARPAHAVIYAEPTEAEMMITPEHLFYYKSKIKSKANHTLKNVYFSPVQKHKLVDASLTRMICGDAMYQLEGKLKTSVNLSFKPGKSLPPSTLYIGIETIQEGFSIKDLSLYFEFLDVEDNDLFYYHLKNAKFYLGDKEIRTVNGYYNSQISSQLDIESIFSSKPSKTRNIEEAISEFYKKNYISILSDDRLKEKSVVMPKELSESIDMDAHEEDLKELHWIKVVFSRIIDDSILDDVYCSVNAFPALNRKWESVSYQLNDFINIVPINTEELFLDVKSVTSTSGKEYTIREHDATEDHKGTFIIRKDNVGKLDSRTAREYILHLIELLKDESASFSFMGNDFLDANVNELNQIIAVLEQKMMEVNKEALEYNYLSVIPYYNKEILFVEYWVTNGEEANKIKLGNKIQIYEGTDIKQNIGFFVTPTIQGKDDLTMDERLRSYRRALLSRNRVVTKEDIRALCYEICGNKVVHIEVQKGFKKNIEINKGLVPCVEIILHANPSKNTKDKDWNSLESNLLSILDEQSLNIFPYIITVKK